MLQETIVLVEPHLDIDGAINENYLKSTIIYISSNSIEGNPSTYSSKLCRSLLPSKATQTLDLKTTEAQSSC